jgi:tetratricopeptide (TPR) repeat protein
MKAMHGLAALFAVAALGLAPSAFAQSGLIAANGERLTEQQAITYLDSFFDSHPVIQTKCGLFDRPAITHHEISATSVRITFCDGKKAEWVFADWPHLRRCVGSACRNWFGKNSLCVLTKDTQSTAERLDWCTGVSFREVPDAQALANAWLALAHPPPPPPRDPAKDEAFLAALKAASGADDRTEANRRAQVQVEALVGAGKTKEAAALYRSALTTSPDWPSGHYNLALIVGDLGDFTEAITEMRRYLYLEPNAADARAAQDQIYKWEALLSTQPPQ